MGLSPCETLNDVVLVIIQAVVAGYMRVDVDSSTIFNPIRAVLGVIGGSCDWWFAFAITPLCVWGGLYGAGTGDRGRDILHLLLRLLTISRGFCWLGKCQNYHGWFYSF